MAALDNLLPILKGIEAADVRSPDHAVASYLQMNHDLATYLEEHPAVRAKLIEVGAPDASFAAHRKATTALGEAESSWQATRKRMTPEQRAALEKKAYAARSDLVASCRWNLRLNKNAQAAIDAVQEGDGVADLSLDLDTLATLVKANSAAFAQDKTFNVAEQIKVAEDLAREVRENLSGGRADKSSADAKDLRDRAFTYLDELWTDLREAGRYAFRGNEDVLQHFRDSVAAARARRARRRMPGPVVDPA